MDISGLLSRKYDILQQNSDAQNRLSWAQSGLLGAETASQPATAAAQAMAARGAGAAGLGQAALSQANAAQVPALAASEEGERSAQAQDLAAHSWLTHIQGTGDPNLTLGANTRFGFNTAPGGGTSGGGAGGWGGGAGNILSLPTPASSNVIGGRPDDRLNNSRFSFSDGTSMVPGQGDGTVDKVKAKLAPGEAVLNKAAAEHLGRSTIDFLNAIGAHKMGLKVGTSSGEAPDKSSPAKGNSKGGPPVNNQTGEPAGYAEGTSDVQVAGDFGKRNPLVASPTPAPKPAPDPNTQGAGQWGPGQGQTLRERLFPRQNADAGGADQPQYFAKGTSKVGKQPHSKNSLPPPAVMQALMAMGGGGAGGMPAPGGPPPLPMPMPQIAPPQGR